MTHRRGPRAGWAAYPRIPVPPGGLHGYRRFAMTGFRCLSCGAWKPASDRPSVLAPCCERMFAVRVDVIEPIPVPQQAAA